MTERPRQDSGARKALIESVLAVAACVAAVAMMLWLLVGCDAAAVGFEAIKLGKPLPDSASLPREARRTRFGIAYVGTERVELGPPPYMAHGKAYSLRALVNDEGAVISKSYEINEAHGYGWLLTTDSRLIVEAIVPPGWSLPVPGDSRRHLGTYLLMVHTALCGLPANTPSEPDWVRLIQGDISGILSSPGAFGRARTRSGTWQKKTNRGYAFCVRNTGEGRIRLEVTYGRVDTPLGVSYR